MYRTAHRGTTLYHNLNGTSGITRTNGDRIDQFQVRNQDSHLQFNGWSSHWRYGKYGRITVPSSTPNGTYTLDFRARDNDGWSDWKTFHVTVVGQPPTVNIPDFIYHYGDPALNIDIANYTTRTNGDRIKAYGWFGGTLPTGLHWSGGQTSPPASIYKQRAGSADTSGWDIYDNSPSGARVSIAWDGDKNMRVVHLSGSHQSNGYRLRTSQHRNWEDRSHHIISWEMKYGESYTVYIATQTTQGFRYIYYTSSSYNNLGTGTYVHHGLGSGTRDGHWHTIVRDLETDLRDAQLNNHITRVDAFLIRGSGYLGDIKLLADPHDAAHGAFTGTPTQAGTYLITAGAKDDDGWGLDTFKLTVIVPKPPVTRDRIIRKYLNEPISYNIEHQYGVSRTDGDPILGYEYSGSIPGVTFNTATGIVSGAATAAGSFDVRFRAKDKDGWSNWSTLTFLITNVDGHSDLCYNAPGYNSMFTCRPDPDYGDFRGGPGCQQFINIQNSGTGTLHSVKLTIDQTPNNDVTMSNCTVMDGSGSTCNSPAHYRWGQYDFNKGVQFNMPNFAPDANVSIGVETSLYGMPTDTRAMVDGTNLYTQYTASDGTLHIAKVTSCSGLTDNDMNVDANFTLIYGGAGTATLGDMVATGDSILYVDNPNTDSYNGSLVDANTSYMLSDTSAIFANDPDPRKRNSSTTRLHLPPYVKSKHIKWAGLFWQGYVHNDKNDPLPAGETVNSVKTRVQGWNKVRIKTPDGGVTEVVADPTIKDINNTAYYYLMVDHDSYRFFYSGYKNVTQLIKNTFDDNGTHQYTVGNILTTHGKDYRDALYIAHANNNAGKWYTDANGGGISIGYFGGWSLVVVYDLLGTDEAISNGGTEAYKNVSIYNGYDFFMTWGDGAATFKTDIALSGFKTPSSGTVDSKLLFFGGGGDKSLALDILQMQDKTTPAFANISDGSNPSDNQFNSTHVVEGAQLNPAKPNHQGMDLDVFDVSSHMGHRQSSTRIRFGVDKVADPNYPNDPSMGSCDQVFPQVLGFSTKLYTPKLCYDFDVHVGNYIKLPVEDDRRFSATKIGNDPLIFSIMLKSEQADFDLQNSRAGIVFDGTPALAFDVDNSLYSPPSTNAYLPAIDTNETDFIAIGEDANHGGGIISSNEINYAKFYHTFTNNNVINDRFNIEVHTQIQFAANLSPIPYILTSDGDENTTGHIDRCEGDQTYDPVYGQFNVERGDATFAMAEKNRYPLYTQVAGRDYTVSLASYGGAPNYNTAQNVSATVVLEAFDADTFENNSTDGFDSVCQNADVNQTFGKGKLFYFDNTDRISNIQTSAWAGYDNTVALRNAAFRVWFFVHRDSNGTRTLVSFNETNKNNFKPVYDSIYRTHDDNTTHYCVSDCATSGTPACYECVKKYFAFPVCSRDNFAIRPEGFRVAMEDANETDANASIVPLPIANNKTPPAAAKIAAGYHYRVNAQAKLWHYAGTTKGYANTISDNNDTTTKKDIAVSEFTGNASCADKSDQAQSVHFYNGTTSLIPSAFVNSNTGQYQYWITDVNWTNVDRASYPYKTTFDTQCRNHPNLAACNDCILDNKAAPAQGKVGCLTSSEIGTDNNYNMLPLTVEPYAFGVNASPAFQPAITASDANGTVRNYLFMNRFSHTYFSDPATQSITMGTQYAGTIDALAKGGAVTTNFTDGCTASDVTLTVVMDDNNNTDSYAMQLYLQSESTANPYLDHNETANDTNSTVVLPAAAFVKNGTAGDGKAQVYLHSTVKKTYRESNSSDTTISSFQGINPIRITYDKLVAEDPDATSQADMDPHHVPEGYDDTNATVTYLYGKVTPGKLYYMDVTDDNKTTALYTDIYCDPTSPYYNDPIFATATYGEDEDKVSWHLANMFSAGNIGPVTLKATHYGAQNAAPYRLSAPGIPPQTAPISSVFDTPDDAMQQAINVSVGGAARPSIVKVQYTPRPWLVYDLGKDFYRVKFIGGGTWNGIGDTGSVSQTRSGKTTKPRMNW